MPFLSRRSVDPLAPPLREKSCSQKPSDLPQTPPRSRARSDGSIFRRVSTLFTARRRSKVLSQPNASPAGIEYRCVHPWPALRRVSTNTTPQSSLEIRRPSGLGRRASLLESDESTASSDLESFGKEIPEERRDTAPKAFASLPNLIGGVLHSPERVTYTRPAYARARHPPSFVLPDLIFRAVLNFLPRRDVAAVALASRGFCAIARYALYHSLDVEVLTESSLGKLYHVLGHNEELAALVVSFYCHPWPSWEFSLPDARVSSVSIDDVRQALQNMYNLKSLTLASFASILSHMPSLSFSLTHLTILDEKITQSQLVAMRSWFATQPSLESLSFPQLVECTSTDPSFIDEWDPVVDPSETDDCGSFTTVLPGLKTLRASTEIVSTLCFAMHNPIEHLTLDVHETLYTGLRPSSVIRSLNGVRDMHVVFGPEVDKRTVEKFLAVAGSMLTGEDKAEAMKSLEVEVSWTDRDAPETLYGIVTSIISRFRGLQTLKLTSPFRSIQAPIPAPVILSLLRPPSLTPTGLTSIIPTVRKEFVPCGVEQNYAKMWTKYCPSLSDIQFDFSCSTTDADVELCGMWFRRKTPMSPLIA